MYEVSMMKTSVFSHFLVIEGSDMYKITITVLP